MLTLLEEQLERAHGLLERYLEDLDDPVLQSLINNVQDLEMAVDAAKATPAR